MQSQVQSIMLVGVGGQGTLLASRILGHAIMQQGYDVKVSEVHGMSQRGGSVVTYVRYGDTVYSPVVNEGEAEFIISFEKLESARWISFLKKDGKLITSTQQIDPMPVITGAAVYPDNLIEKMQAKGIEVLPVDALALAKEAGNEKSVNVVLIGVLSKLLPFSNEVWEKALDECVPAKFLDANKNAFDLGQLYSGKASV